MMTSNNIKKSTTHIVIEIVNNTTLISFQCSSLLKLCDSFDCKLVHRHLPYLDFYLKIYEIFIQIIILSINNWSKMY